MDYCVRGEFISLGVRVPNNFEMTLEWADCQWAIFPTVVAIREQNALWTFASPFYAALPFGFFLSLVR